MNQWQEKSAENKVFRLAFLGIWCEIIGVPLFLMFGLVTSRRVPLPLGGVGALLILAGIVLIATALILGLLANATAKSGPEKVYQGAQIINRFATDTQGEYLMDWQYDEDSRYFVKIGHPSLGVIECQTSRQVYDECPEGGTGQVIIQGRWLSQFVRYHGVGIAQVGDPRFGNQVSNEETPGNWRQ